MSKKLIVTIIIASILTISFVLVAVGIIGPKNTATPKQQLSQINVGTPIAKTATLYFSPPQLSINPLKNTPTIVNVVVNTGATKISGAQLELNYDPEILQNVQVISPQNSFFGNASEYQILFNDVDSANGRISFAIAARTQEFEKEGNGNVATISFTVNPTATAATTNLQFAPTTLITTFGTHQTVLREAAGITLLFDRNLSLAQ